MGNKKNRKVRNDAQANALELDDFRPSLLQSIKHLLLQPINKLIVRFLLAMILFYLVWATPTFQEYVIKNIAIAYAKISSFLLNLMNYDVSRIQDSVGNGVFSISIKNGCDGVEGCALFICALLVYPATILNKFKGVILGLLFLVGLNLIRIVSLFMIGVHIPSIFDVMHESVWQVVFIIFSLLTLLVFINSTKK